MTSDVVASSCSVKRAATFLMKILSLDSYINLKKRWTLDSEPLPLVNKLKAVNEALQWRSELCNGESKCKVTSIEQNWEVNWTCNAIHPWWAALSFEEQLTWRKLLTWTDFPFSLLLATTADAFFYEGIARARDQLSALCRNTRKKQTSQVSNAWSALSFPKAQFYSYA